jgi:hypothetical protein
MGASAIIYGLAVAYNENEKAWATKEAFERQAGELGTQATNMQTALTKNLRQYYTDFQRDRKEMLAAAGSEESGITKLTEKSVGQIKGGYGSSNVKIGQGTAARVVAKQQEEGMKARSNVHDAARSQKTRMTSDYTAGRDTMNSNATEAIRKLTAQQTEFETQARVGYQQSKIGSAASGVAAGVTMSTFQGSDWITKENAWMKSLFKGWGSPGKSFNPTSS